MKTICTVKLTKWGHYIDKPSEIMCYSLHHTSPLVRDMLQSTMNCLCAGELLTKPTLSVGLCRPE